MFQVPAVDITAYVGDGTAEQRAAVAREVDAACREVGFIQLFGHGVPADVIDGLGTAMDAFFGLDPDSKLGYVRPPGENRGYTPPRSESLSLSLGIEPANRMNDFFEAFNVGRAASEYAGRSLTAVELGGDLTGMGEHTDYGIVTILWADPIRGLQVLGRDGVWHDVSPDPGALLVNLGDLTARLTNERWLSTLHRVKPPVVAGTVERRRSAAYFHDGNPEAVVAPLDCCVDADHPPLYDPVTVDEHIRAKLAGSRAGLRNTAVARESARVLQSER